MTSAIVRVGERVTRVRAPNPSPMTLDGTNSYLIEAGWGRAVVVDPGPAEQAHIGVLSATAAEARRDIAGILVTHGHPDHAPGAAMLRAQSGAPVYAHPDARFPFDIACDGSEPIAVGELRIGVDYAPGHARDHLVFSLPTDAVLFTGDVVIGRGTVVVAPPGGDMRAYQATLERLRDRHADARVILGGHGEPVDDPVAKLDEYIVHRIAREQALLTVFEARHTATIPEIVQSVYVDTPPMLWPAAARQVLAYLEALEREGRVRSHRLERAPTPFEASLLHPDLSRIVDHDAADVARAELGFDPAGTALVAYELVSRSAAFSAGR